MTGGVRRIVGIAGPTARAVATAETAALTGRKNDDGPRGMDHRRRGPRRPRGDDGRVAALTGGRMAGSAERMVGIASLAALAAAAARPRPCREDG